MSLEELKKEQEAELKAALEAEKKTEEEPVEEEQEEANDNEEPSDQPEQDEKSEEAPKEEPKQEKEEHPAKLRIDKEAAIRRAEKAEAELAALRAGAEKPVDKEVEVTAIDDPDIAEIKQERMFAKAAEEFTSLEAKFKAKADDYENVSREYVSALAHAVKLENPRLTDAAIIKETQRRILMKAGNYMREGYENPAEALYHEAKELGYTGKSFVREEAAQEKEVKPDLRKVATNRAKSAGMAATSGRSEGQLTPMAANDMTAGEWSKLSKEQKDAVFAQLRARA